jgi:hypothetical protein
LGDHLGFITGRGRRSSWRLFVLDGWKELLLSMMYAVAERESIQRIYISLCPAVAEDEISAGI